MEKNEAVQYIKEVAAQKVLTKEEAVAAYDEGAGTRPGSKDLVLIKKLGIAEILYYIGGAIVFLGIAILVWQNWSTLSFPTRLIATLGAAVGAYILGYIFGREEKFETIGSAFYLISALVLPIGLYVLFDNAGFDTGSAGVQSLISGIALAVFLLSYAALRKNIFTLFSIIFSTWFFFDLTNFMVAGNPLFGWSFFEYRVLVAGISYLLIGYAFSKSEKSSLSGFLYGFGILGFLGAALALGGWSPAQNVFWELIFPGLALATLFTSVYLKAKSFLTFGSLFLMAYILKITGEYFASGLGWPLALVLAGLMLIAVGYLYVYLKKKYSLE